MKVYKITNTDGETQVHEHIEEIVDEVENMDAGDTMIVKVVEMTQEEFDALPED